MQVLGSNAWIDVSRTMVSQIAGVKESALAFWVTPGMIALSVSLDALWMQLLSGVLHSGPALNCDH
jgi:hypothetical protein